MPAPVSTAPELRLQLREMSNNVLAHLAEQSKMLLQVRVLHHWQKLPIDHLQRVGVAVRHGAHVGTSEFRSVEQDESPVRERLSATVGVNRLASGPVAV